MNKAFGKETDTPDEAKLLFAFFTSEGVTERLSRRLSTLFYSASGSGSSGPGTLYPSVTSRTNSPSFSTTRA